MAERNDFTVVSNHEEANIIASIGGDGMFLQAVRKTGFREDCLYAGITDDSYLGLYCDFHIDDHHAMIDAMTMEQIEVRRYPVIKVDIDEEGSFYCLNEFTIRSGIIKTLVMDVFIDGLHFETFRGDGMVIASPTGSTAYNKSVKGAVVDPVAAMHAGKRDGFFKQQPLPYTWLIFYSKRRPKTTSKSRPRWQRLSDDGHG